MRWPIRLQILLPFGAALLVGVAVTSVAAAYLAARRSADATTEQLRRVTDTLAKSNFPFSPNVLAQMRGLSGAEFVVYGPSGPVASTLDAPLPSPDALSAPAGGTAPWEAFPGGPTLTVDGRRYFAATVRPPASGVRTVLVLYPERSWRQALWQAAVPPLAVGAGTFLVMVAVSAWLAGRFGRRIRRLQGQVAQIAEGDFRELGEGGRRDELLDLTMSVNRLSRRLREMSATIAGTERARLLGQMAGGLAHGLRNALTGARMAVQLHRRSCPHADDESLSVALRQLELTEEQVQALLSVGQRERAAPQPRPPADVLREVAALVTPTCRHARVELESDIDDADGRPASDAAAVRSAVLNLALNAIEAAGAGGFVRLSVRSEAGSAVFEVLDDGSGPSAEVAERIFDAFVTTKPEGVGLGLAAARQAADALGGTLTWDRQDGRTRFRLTVPLSEDVADAAT